MPLFAAPSCSRDEFDSHYRENPHNVILITLDEATSALRFGQKNTRRNSGGYFFGSDQPSFCEGHDRGVGHDKVVEHFDVDERQRLPKLVGKHLVGA